MNSMIKYSASWFVATFLSLLSFVSLAQGIKVNDGAFLKAGTGTYIKVKGTNTGVLIDTNSTLKSDAQWSIDGDLKSYGSVNLNTSTVDLQGNWLNKGSFDAGSSLVKFSGSVNQYIYHQGNSFYNIEIVKPSDSLALQSDVGVSNQFSFTNGMLNTSVDTLMLGTTASLVNERDGNYAQGYVHTERTVNGSIEYFGQSGVKLDASSNSQDLGIVSVTRAAGLLKVDTSYIVSSDNTSDKSIDRIWNIKAQNAPSDSIDLTFAWISENDNGNSDRDSMYIYIKDGSLIWDTLGSLTDGTSRVVSGRTLSLSSFTIAPKMSLPFKANFSADTVCLGSPSSFKDSSIVWGSGITYSWDFNNDGVLESSTVGDVQYTYSSAGLYNVKLKISNNEGKKDSIVVKVLVEGQVLASVHADTVCAGTVTTFTNKGSAFTGVSYAWDFNNDGTVENTSQDPVSYAYPGAGTYKAVLVLTADHCSSKDTTDVLVNPLPTVDAGADKDVQSGSSISLQPTYSGTIQSYSWSPSTYLDSSASATSVSTPLADITYTITVTTDKGCITSDNIYIHVIKDLFIPTGFTPDNDGVNDIWEIPDLKNYPDATIAVFDRAGQKVFEGNNTNFWDGTYNGNPSPAGSYYFIINLGSDANPVSGNLTLIRLEK